MAVSLLIHPEELTKKWIDRARALGYSAIALHPRGGGEAADTLSQLLELLETPEYRALLDYAAGAGLNIEYQFHAAGRLLPRTLFEKHPEYFRKDESGARNPDLNLCVSNADALEIVKEHAVMLAKRLYRSTHRFYFWADDAKAGACKCEKCRGLSASDQNLTLMNAIITALRGEIPDAELAYLAYRDTLPVPAAVKPAKGIFLEYAPIERDVHTPIAAQTYGAERELIAFFGEKGATVLEYWLDNSLFSKWKKPPAKFAPDRPVIDADLRYYKSVGFENAAAFACFLGEDYEALYGEPDVPPLKF